MGDPVRLEDAVCKNKLVRLPNCREVAGEGEKGPGELERVSRKPVDDAVANAAGAVAVGFARALVGGDASAAAAYFAPGAQFVTPDGTQVTGRDSILALLVQLTAAEQRLESGPGGRWRRTRSPSAPSSGAAARRSPRADCFRALSTARLVLARGAGGWETVIADALGVRV